MSDPAAPVTPVTTATTAHSAGAPGHGPEPHDTEAHGDGHGPDDHAHVDEPLGPIDWAAWAVGASGVAIGLIMWGCFAFATS